jgi:hypothetical protein
MCKNGNCIFVKEYGLKTAEGVKTITIFIYVNIPIK